MFLSGMQRRIIHIDMDAFYASIEQRDRAMRGRPVVVGGKGGRGVVAAASYEARRYGIRSAMPVAEAERRCPSLIVLPVRMDRYREESERIRALFAEVTELIEPVSLDEAYLDVTGRLAAGETATAVALRVKERIRAELDLTATAGIGPCKSVAKMASAFRKPDGVTVVHPARVEAFLDGLEVEQLHGVGPATAARLRAMGVRTGRDLRAVPRPVLVERFGRSGDWFYRLVRGDDDRPVRIERVRKSVSSERTFFAGLRTRDAVCRALDALGRRVADRLGRHGLAGRTVTVKVRYFDFSEFSRSTTLSAPCASAGSLVPHAAHLVDDVTGRRPVRLLGLGVSNLLPSALCQLSLDL